VRLNEVPLAQGEGHSKKQAAQRAARLALENLKGKETEPEEGETVD
jgi:dsRNA-specific ribonuclease